MRKVLSFVLVLAMILGSVSMVFAANFSDTTGKSYATAAATLNELGVISGYADGTFGGEKNITRAEFATMVVNALGFPTTGSADTGFKDVPKDYWAAQAIYTAKNLGIVYGRTATTFDPKANITCDEAIAMLVRGLGYKAEYLNGTYPTNYVNQAMSLMILNKVPTGSVVATRGNIAQLIYNALDCRVVSAYNGFTNTWVSGAALIERLGYTNDADSNGVADTGFWTKLDDNFGLFGKIYTKTTDSTKKFFIPTTHFVTGKYDATAKTITAADATKTYVDNTAIAVKKTFMNGEDDLSNTVAGGAAYTSTFVLANGANADGSYNLYSRVVWDGKDFFAPAEVQDDIKDATLNGASFVTMANGSIKAGTYYLNGVAKLEDIKEDDVVTIYGRPSDGKITRVDVSRKTVEGQLVKIGYNTVTELDVYYVADGTYDWAKTAQQIGAPVALGSDGTFYLNYAGAVTKFTGKTTAAKYAVVVGAKNYNSATNTISSENGQIQLFIADGTTVIYDVNETKVTTPVATSLATLFLKGDLVRYQLEGDKVVSLTKITASAGTTISKAGVLLGNQRLTDKTVVFAIDDKGNASLANYADLYGATALTAVYDDKNSDFVVDALAYTASSIPGATKYYVFGSAFKDNYNTATKTTYYTMNAGFVDGEAVADFSVSTAAAVGTVYKVASTSNGIATLANITPTVATTTIASINTNTLVVYTGADCTGTPYQLASDVVVYYVKSNKVYKGTISSLKTYNQVELYNTLAGSANDKFVYDIVVAH